jgi:hypothetical protein
MAKETCMIGKVKTTKYELVKYTRKSKNTLKKLELLSFK